MAIKENQKYIILLFIILVVASFFRLWQLENIPPGIYPDEAMNTDDAITSPGKLFYPANNGREGLFINLIAASFYVFGISIWSFKIVPAIIGILTVLVLYFLTKELFSFQEKRAEKIALLSSFFLAVSFWHINFSRIDFRAILVPLVLSASFCFLFRGFRTQKIWNFIISGIIFGLGFYTYIAFRLSVLLLIPLLISFFLIYLKEKGGLKRFLIYSFFFIFFAFISALPMGIYFLQNPEQFISRTTGVSIFAQENVIKSFAESFIKHIGMFNFYGDPNWRHNFSGHPQLYWPIGILFLLGIIISIKKITASLKTKNYSLFNVHLFLLSWIFAMLLPAILTYEGIPHALRAIGVIPPAYILAGMGGIFAYDFLKRKIKNKGILVALCLLFLVFVGSNQFYKYFFSWAPRTEVKEAFTKRYTEIGYYLNSLPEETQKYVIVNELGNPLYGISIPAQTPMFIERTKFKNLRAQYLTTEELGKIKIEEGKTIIIPLYEKGIFELLEEKFPSGTIEEKEGIKIYKI